MDNLIRKKIRKIISEVIREEKFSIDEIKAEDISQILDLCVDVFKHVMSPNGIKSYLKHSVDWKISKKATLNGKIIGCYLLREGGIPHGIEGFELEDLSKYKDKFLFFMHSYNSKQIKSIINRIRRIKIESVKSQDFEGSEMLRNIEKHFIKLSNEKPRFLVRPDDHHIFEIDETNNCYRSYMGRNVTRQDGTRPNAQSHFTLENLTNNYGFFPIDENQIPQHEKLNKLHHEFLSWQCRPDGHGGSKGGTMEEFLSKK